MWAILDHVAKAFHTWVASKPMYQGLRPFERATLHETQVLELLAGYVEGVRAQTWFRV